MGRLEGFAGMTTVDRFRAAMDELPLVAILRGLKPDEAPAIGDVLVEAGFRLIEVPLNSPQPLESIELLRKRFPDVTIGAGTVLTEAEVRDVASAGGELIVAPNFDRNVVVETVRLGLASLPGIMTPTEAFAALNLSTVVIPAKPSSRPMSPRHRRCARGQLWSTMREHSARSAPRRQ